MKTASLLFLAAMISCLSIPASAAVVTNINTGATTGGTLIPRGQVDPRWQLVAAPATFGTLPHAMYAVQPVDNVSPPFVIYTNWVADTANSRWIVPYDNGTVSLATTSPAGTYKYRTTFDLTGFDASTAVLQGSYAFDDYGSEIVFNGVSKGFATSQIGQQGFNQFTNFTINSGFVAGINTIDFVGTGVNQATGNPTGIQVFATVTATAIPEPASLFALGTGALALLWRRGTRSRN